MTQNINSFSDTISGYNKAGPLSANTVTPDDFSALYDALYTLYKNDAALGSSDTTRRLRTVVARSVDFYASKLLPGTKIEITSNNAALVAALDFVLKSSNFQGNKPGILRGFALYGDSFIRVRWEDGRFHLEDQDPHFVTDFEEDSAGRLTSLRIDIPTLDDNRNPVLYTEYWSLEDQTVKTWVTQNSSTTPLASFGEPQTVTTFAELGIDFIPIIHTKFKDIGDPRGVPCTYHALDKIIEANRLATKLHDMQFRFNKPLWAFKANATDKNGYPIPVPDIEFDSTSQSTKEDTLGEIVKLPGVSDVTSLVPDVKYADALAILNAQMEEIEQDLPELRYYSLKESDLSGKAIKALLAGAADRAEEARNNFLASLHTMLEMALAIGEFNGAFSVSGDLAFDLKVDEMFGQDMNERAATLKTLTDAGMPLPIAMKNVGFSPEEIEEAIGSPNAAEQANP